MSGVRAAKKGANTAGAELQEAVGAATGREREYSWRKRCMSRSGLKSAERGAESMPGDTVMHMG